MGNGGRSNGPCVWPLAISLLSAAVTCAERERADSKFLEVPVVMGPLKPKSKPCAKPLSKKLTKDLSGWFCSASASLCTWIGDWTNENSKPGSGTLGTMAEWVVVPARTAHVGFTATWVVAKAVGIEVPTCVLCRGPELGSWTHDAGPELRLCIPWCRGGHSETEVECDLLCREKSDLLGMSC